MKKQLALIMALSLSLSLVGCGSGGHEPGGTSPADDPSPLAEHDALPKDIDFTAQYIRTDGYIEGEAYPKSLWITSPSELREYYEANRDKYDLDTRGTPGETETLGFLDVLESYDDYFFASRDLIVVLLEEPSGSIRHQVQRVEVTSSGLSRVQYLVQPVIERLLPEVGTADMAEWHILIAVGKEHGQLYSELLEPAIADIEG